MKRAPVIPKSNNALTSSVHSPVTAAPMVDSLIARVGAMAKGNSIALPVCGREVKFSLETIPGSNVASTTRVWVGNERDQELLTEDAVSDLIPSFLLTGQQTPAFGRKVDDLIEVADGSRRRKTAIYTGSEYRILVGDLDDEQMDAICKLGNDYRPTSAYERGNRYIYRLNNEFNGNISALSEAENISRKIINRCISTAKLPKSVIALFSHPGELSARAGETLYRAFFEKEKLLLDRAEELSEKKSGGVVFEPDELVMLLTEVLNQEKITNKKPSTKRKINQGAFVEYKGNKVIFNLDRTLIPNDYIDKIESLLSNLIKN